MGADKLLAAFGVDEDSAIGQAIKTRKKKLFDRALLELKPPPGARALLEYLREQGIAVVVATSADDREVKALLQRAGVEDLLPQRASKEAAASSKPEPDIIKAALARAGARSGAAIMVGDTPYDIEAANRAGVDTIALRCGGYWSDGDLRGALAILDDPAALLACWRDVSRRRA
jgi:HAD superfamily hydrolase (TIGR01509 family)